VQSWRCLRGNPIQRLTNGLFNAKSSIWRSADTSGGTLWAGKHDRYRTIGTPAVHHLECGHAGHARQRLGKENAIVSVYEYDWRHEERSGSQKASDDSSTAAKSARASHTGSLLPYVIYVLRQFGHRYDV
jgi:hypothetical protein